MATPRIERRPSPVKGKMWGKDYDHPRDRVVEVPYVRPVYPKILLSFVDEEEARARQTRSTTEPRYKGPQFARHQPSGRVARKYRKKRLALKTDLLQEV